MVPLDEGPLQLDWLYVLEAFLGSFFEVWGIPRDKVDWSSRDDGC